MAGYGFANLLQLELLRVIDVGVNLVRVPGEGVNLVGAINEGAPVGCGADAAKVQLRGEGAASARTAARVGAASQTVELRQVQQLAELQKLLLMLKSAARPTRRAQFRKSLVELVS